MPELAQLLNNREYLIVGRLLRAEDVVEGELKDVHRVLISLPGRGLELIFAGSYEVREHVVKGSEGSPLQEDRSFVEEFS